MHTSGWAHTNTMVQRLINFSKRLQKKVSGLAQATNTHTQALTLANIFWFPGNVTKSMHAYIYPDIYLLCIMCFPHILSFQPDLLPSRSWDFRVKVFEHVYTCNQNVYIHGNFWHRGYLCIFTFPDAGSSTPTGGLGINYRPPEAEDRLLGNNNMPESHTVRLSSFDFHIIRTYLYHTGLRVHVIEKRTWIHMGFGKHSYCTFMVMKQKQALLCCWPLVGVCSSQRTVVEAWEPHFCALTVWLTADMTGSWVASQSIAESSPCARALRSRKIFKGFPFCIVAFSGSDQLHVAIVSSGHHESLHGTTLYKL